ncbi:ATP-dependent helicase [Marinobacter sp.]|uniref:ATP-dependent helicase n=1 Tax=Marinobacter sp. TaxID=50741 RepID=UPI00198E2ED8|nr:ATP-dependent helicase [Marinobacter sp.]MBC7191198.1 ATP-dependent helicase [Marinobacter sp.]
MDLPAYLTDEQQRIITAPAEHTVITAVAGSGKTTTLAWRIRYLLAQGYRPDRLLVLMFNRSARNDFQRKLQSVTHGAQVSLPEIRTYHSMGLRLYRRFVQEGYLPAFSDKILTEQEISFQAWQLTRQLAPEELQDEIRRNKKDFVETATGFIDRVKSTLSPAAVVFEELGYSPHHYYLIDLFHSFEQWRKSHARISYADMLYEPVMAIHQNPPLQQLVANKMELILVDEYQDTNEIQHLLLGYIAGTRARVTVVGDPDQTIYEFRGARPEFILSRFAEEFDQPREQTLSYSFRYGHHLALLANHLITHNRGRKDVLCHAHPVTPHTTIEQHTTENDADTVVKLLESMPEAEQTDSAILFRVWSQSVPIELKLLSREIPYRIDAGKGALFSREVASLTALLTLLGGSPERMPEEDRMNMARLLLQFPHVGLKAPELDNLARFLARFPDHWDQRLLSLDFDALPPMAARKLKTLGETLQQLGRRRQSAGAQLRNYITSTDLFEGVRSLALTHESADERIDTITGFVRYLENLDIGVPEAITHLNNLKARASLKQQGGVLLSTIHRTKGLEWPRVILPGLQEKYLPYSPRKGSQTEDLVASERRLLYVAMTRASHQLHLLVPGTGDTPHLDGERVASRFVGELHFALSQALGDWLNGREPEQTTCELAHAVTGISRRYAEREGIRLEGAPTPETTNPGPVWANPRVNHGIYGPGTVRGETESAFEVRFDNGESRIFSKTNAHLYFRTA